MPSLLQLSRPCTRFVARLVPRFELQMRCSVCRDTIERAHTHRLVDFNSPGARISGRREAPFFRLSPQNISLPRQNQTETAKPRHQRPGRFIETLASERGEQDCYYMSPFFKSVGLLLRSGSAYDRFLLADRMGGLWGVRYGGGGGEADDVVFVSNGSGGEGWVGSHGARYAEWRPRRLQRASGMGS